MRDLDTLVLRAGAETNFLGDKMNENTSRRWAATVENCVFILAVLTACLLFMGSPDLLDAIIARVKGCG